MKINVMYQDHPFIASLAILSLSSLSMNLVPLMVKLQSDLYREVLSTPIEPTYSFKDYA
jgi:hypothetical protein